MKINKKGMEISLNFVIIAVLALVALIVIALFFTGGMSKIFTKQATVVKLTDQEMSLLEAGCDTYCSLCQEGMFNAPPFDATLKNQGIDTCEKLFIYRQRPQASGYYANVCKPNCERKTAAETAAAPK